MQRNKPPCWTAVVFGAFSLLVFISESSFGQQPEKSAAHGAVRKRVDRIKIVDHDAKFNMVYIPEGTFTMGSADDDPAAQRDEKPAHRVAVDAFWMLEHEVTWHNSCPGHPKGGIGAAT